MLLVVRRSDEEILEDLNEVDPKIGIDLDLSCLRELGFYLYLS